MDDADPYSAESLAGRSRGCDSAGCDSWLAGWLPVLTAARCLVVRCQSLARCSLLHLPTHLPPLLIQQQKWLRPPRSPRRGSLSPTVSSRPSSASSCAFKTALKTRGHDQDLSKKRRGGTRATTKPGIVSSRSKTMTPANTPTALASSPRRATRAARSVSPTPAPRSSSVPPTPRRSSATRVAVSVSSRLSLRSVSSSPRTRSSSTPRRSSTAVFRPSPRPSRSATSSSVVLPCVGE